MWFEVLPTECPDNAHAIDGCFYRLISGEKISCKDFWSHRKIWPNKAFNVDECRAHSLSVFDNYADCEVLIKLPAHRTKAVAKVDIDASCGLVKQTGNKLSHYSWWRSDTFEPERRSSVVTK